MSEASRRRRRRRARRAMVSALAGGGLTAAGLGSLAGAAQGQSPVPPVNLPAPPLPIGGSVPTGPTGPGSGPVVIGSPQGQPDGGGPAVSHQGTQPTSGDTTTTTHTRTAHQPAAKPKVNTPPKAKPKPKPAVPTKPASHAGHPSATNPLGPNSVALPPQLVADQFGVLPPSLSTTVSAAALQFYHVPMFLLPILQAAAIQYGVPWQVLAAINEVETDYGRDLNVSSAGAIGWMQFLPATWLLYGVDASNAGFADPYNPADAIFAAARYLSAAGARSDLKGAIFAYNHSAAYVDSVLLRAKLIASYPQHIIASLTGLAEGQVPVQGAAVVPGSVPPAPSPAPAPAPATATAGAKPVPPPVGPTTHTPHPAPRFALVQGPRNAVVRAVADGRVLRIGHSTKLGTYLVLRDVYDDVFTYAGLGSLATGYNAPPPPRAPVRVAAPEQEPTHAPTSTLPASAGVQPPLTLHVTAPPPPTLAPAVPPPVKLRLYAHPSSAVRAAARAVSAAVTAHGARWLPLRSGSVVTAGTALGRVTTTLGDLHGHFRFALQPSGDTQTVDPTAIIKNWQELQNTLNPIGAKGDAGLIGATAGYVFLLSQTELQQAVLSDPGISIYACGRQDIASGQINARVLAVLAFLSRSGLKATVTGLRCGHNPRTAAGTASAHASGNGVDISAINGMPIARHQGRNSITDATIRTLLALQGRFIPFQIISLMTYPGAANTVAVPDAFDHLDIVFRPEAPSARTRTAGHAAAAPSTVDNATLTADQWDQLVTTVAALPSPNIATTPSSASVRDPQAAPANQNLGTLPLPAAPGH